MARLSEQLGQWLSRAELLARGAEWQRQEAVQALAQDRPWDARQHALAILDEVPRSRVALALWADAAESMLLDNEAVEALARLADAVPFRADVWLRLAQARWRLGEDPRGALERASDAGDPVAAADAARLWLADLDLGRRDPERAERWLEQLSLGGRGSPEALLRRVEVALEAGDSARAAELAEGLPQPGPLDARLWLIRGRLGFEREPDAAVRALERALMLEAPGAGRIAAELVAKSTDPALVARLATIVEELGFGDHPLWRAAFARAHGRKSDALAAIADAVRCEADPELVGELASLALEARDPVALREAVALGPVDAGSAALARALAEPDPATRLIALDEVSGAAAGWARELRRAIYAAFVPEEGAADWEGVLAEIGSVARGLGALDAVQRAESIAMDLERPLRVAVVGEFNAGKSSFINALLGEPVAPVGVLPTTATLNRLVWAPDRFVRIERAGADDRLVPHADLRRALAEVDLSSVKGVTIYAPLEPLRRLEIIDTPGFNAPDARHAVTARAAFTEAHVALWLLDASQPLKQSERAVLSEARELGLPLVVLVNKLDRLADEAAQAEALTHVAAGLAEARIEPLAPPLAFSARLALAGRAGDAAALSASRWGAVESLIEKVLVEGSEQLRERMLRRRAADVVAQLASIAEERATARRERAERLARRAEHARQAASRARSERARIVRDLALWLDEVLEEAAVDLRPASGGAADPAARRFVARRVRAAAAAGLTERAIALSCSDADARGELDALLGPRVAAMCLAVGPWLVFELDAAGRAAAREELAGHVADELAAVADQLAAAPLPAVSLPGELRARELLEVLSARA